MRLADLFLQRDASRIAALQLVARQTVEGLTAGRHRSPQKGSSVEFKAHRPYVPGDDLKSIDWKAYGKSDRLYIRQFEEETNLRCTLMVDCSGSMGYGGSRSLPIKGIHETNLTHATGRTAAPTTTKQDFALALSAALAYLLLSSQDSVGLMTFDTKIRDSIPPRNRASQLTSLLRQLGSARSGGETDLADVIGKAPPKLPRRGLVIVISDGFGDPESVGQALAAMRAHQQDIMFLQVLDRDEIDFPFEERIEFIDLEHSEQRELIDARSLRAQYLEALADHNAAITRVCHRHRIDHALLTTDQPLVDGLARFLRLRQAFAAGIRS
ncbi:MAG: DUF58 domain-containing protein [Planctomycetota bacterium]